ncbi:MAG: Hpt domain-containing protein [Xanthomonadaceae bacterium]|nr:Hpt domain-containing protein [Xanthomonadaceae bacterium]
MNEDEQLQRQIADIGTRYLKRTVGEIEQLRSYLQSLREGSHDALRSLASMAHKIHGSGAMFGFDRVSERAYEIEQLARQGSGEDACERLGAAVDALADEVRRQAHARGVQ